MAARFWRVAGVESRNGGGLSLSEVALFDSTGRVDAAAQVSSTIAPDTGLLSSLSDGLYTESVAWVEAQVPGFAIQWDFGPGVSKDIQAIGVCSPSITGSMQACQVLFSDDGVVWSPAGVAAFEYIDSATLSKFSALDEFPDRVVLLSTSQGAMAFQDASPSNKSLSVNGAVILSSEMPLYGGKTLKMNGGESSLTTVSPDFQFATDPLTLEAWIYALSAESGGFGNLTTFNEGGAGISFWLTGGGAFRVRVGRSEAGQFDDVLGVGSFPTNQWVHVAVTREHTGANGIKLWIGGNLNAQGSSARGVNSTRFALGRPYPYEGSGGLVGYFGGAKITRGIARYVSPFTPPEGRFENMAQPALRPQRNTTHIGAVSIGSEVLGLTTSKLAEIPLTKDIYDSGKGRVVGTVKEKGTPNAPLKREVFLFDQITWRQIRATWSDPVTGEYVFNELDMNRKYAVVAEDYTHMYRAVIADNLSPELMPQFV